MQPLWPQVLALAMDSVGCLQTHGLASILTAVGRADISASEKKYLRSLAVRTSAEHLSVPAVPQGGDITFGLLSSFQQVMHAASCAAGQPIGVSRIRNILKQDGKHALATRLCSLVKLRR